MNAGLDENSSIVVASFDAMYRATMFDQLFFALSDRPFASAALLCFSLIHVLNYFSYIILFRVNLSCMIH
jgi:hypothetical protein